MEVVVSAVNFIDLITASFSLICRIFMLNMGADVLHHTEVRWLSCGTVKTLFISEKSKVVAELRDEKWLWDLTLLCDISYT
jgi:hypothetical protein